MTARVITVRGQNDQEASLSLSNILFRLNSPQPVSTFPIYSEFLEHKPDPYSSFLQQRPEIAKLPLEI